MTNQPRYLAPSARPVGTQLTSTRRDRQLHAVGCQVDGGTHRHGRRGFRCRRCAQTVEDRVDGLLERLDRFAGGGSR